MQIGSGHRRRRLGGERPGPPAPGGTGLSEEEAARQLAAWGPNVVVVERRTPVWRRVVRQLRDPLIVVLLVAAVLTVVTGDLTDTVVIVLVITVNTVVGVVQEVRAEQAVAALSAMSAPAARVVRGGTTRSVRSADVVPGDVALLGEGDIVPADGEVLEAAQWLLDESSLTGESVPVEKTPYAGPGEGVVSAGTVVVRGRGVVRVTATGPHSALGRIAALLGGEPELTPLQRRLVRFGKILALVTLVLCAVVLALGLARGQPAELMVVAAISLAVAAVPESLPAVVTLALALGARRMAERQAIVPVASQVMRAPPRPPEESVLGAGLWVRILAMGSADALITLAAGAWAHLVDRPWQTMVFMVLGATQLGVALGSRARPGSLANPFLLVAVAGSLALQVTGVYLPPLRTPLGTEPLTALEIGISCALSALGYALMRLQARVRKDEPRAPLRAAA
ncbi:HAD-IC family P-type ATPase [Streptomyces sp. NPDC018031]|uniref:HAD-IC family P-type ATPase n=1 Tax=Streptomyces sp. NPDC018031 TaxID=3365033 RepID=UPI0037AA95DB